MKRVLVTGGAGFIGSHLVDRLIREGSAVAVVDDLSTGKSEHLNREASFYQVDIRDADALERVFTSERPEVVSHHAAQTDVTRSMREPAFDAQVNVLGAVNLLQLCVKYGVRKVVFASTSAVYPEPEYVPADERHPVRPLSAYGLTKYVTEQYLALYREAYGLASTIFRYGNVYGPRQDPNGESGVVAIFLHQLSSGIQPTLFGDGTKTRDYIFVDDVVSAVMLAMQGGGDGEVFNLGWGEEISDFEVFDAVRGALGATVAPKYAPKRPGELDRIALDSRKAQRMLRWTPQIRFDEGVSRCARAYRDIFQNTR